MADWVPFPWSTTIEAEASIFQPRVHLTLDKPGVFDAIVDVVAPNSCYVAAGCAPGMPPGMDFAIPEHEHLLCKAVYQGGINRMCLMYLKPLRWDCQDLKIGTGKSHLVVHIVLNDHILAGSVVVKLPVNV